ncbi:MAG: hypothetical protein SFX74_07490 [Fimbriimonadaceae bacterium]|nr:hypothetical protein [Fimbriimonadaceae bacterium]
MITLRKVAVAAISVLVQAAIAQHYTVTYSGGAANGTPYAMQSNGFYGGGVSGTFSGSCSGTITATFTWVPGPGNTPPPKSVVVTRKSLASWSGGNAAGSCSNGLGHASRLLSSSTVPLPPPWGTMTNVSYQSGSSVEEAEIPDYEVKSNPGASFTVTCSPSASYSAPLPPTPGWGACGVAFQASASPVVLSIANTVWRNQELNILIGQRASATIACSGFTVASSVYSVGGDTISNYIITADRQQAFVVPTASPIVENTSWYWKRGTTSGEAASVMGSAVLRDSRNREVSVNITETVKVWKPYSGFGANSNHLSYYSGYSNGFPSFGGPPGPLYATSLAPPNIVGIRFSGEVGIQSFFTPQVSGIWHIVQLAKVNRVFTGGQSPWQNGRFELDNFWPYAPEPPSQGLAANSLEEGVPIQNQVVPGGDDTPTNILTNTTSFVIADNFKMWQMFRPSGPASIWVPLNRIDWHWTATGAAPYPISDTPIPESWVGTTTSSTTPDHPVWDAILTNT